MRDFRSAEEMTYIIWEGFASIVAFMWIAITAVCVLIALVSVALTFLFDMNLLWEMVTSAAIAIYGGRRVAYYYEMIWY